MKSHRVLFLLIIFFLIIQTIPIAKSGYGEIDKGVSEVENLKQFLRDNFKWRLQASPNNATWYNANELLTIKLDWVDVSSSYKVTLTLNTTTAPQSLYYRFDLAFNKTIQEYIVVDDWKLKLTVAEYPLYFDFSDIRQLVNTSKVWIDKGIKNNFFWFRVQTVNQIAVGKTFVIDPYYGSISPIKVSYYVWDAQEGEPVSAKSMVRLNSTEYYITVARGDSGTDDDGWVRVLKVSNTNGAITHSVISSFEYDASDGFSACIEWIPSTDKYVIAYEDLGSSKVTLVTVQIWANNGTIKPSVIDSQQLTQNGENLMLQRFTDNVYIASYYEAVSLDGWMETWWVDYDGMITNAVLDTEEFDTAWGTGSYLCNVDSNTVAITYVSSSGTGDYSLMTYNITALGIITDTPADSWAYESSPAGYSLINKIGTNKFMLTYIDGSYEIYAKTVSIADNGAITKSFIDTTTVASGGNTVFLMATPIHDPLYSANGSGIYVVTTRGMDSSPERDGYMYTWEVNTSGRMGRVLNSFEFNTTQCWTYAPIIWVNQSWYFIIYGENLYHGIGETIFIYTNWATPTVSNIFPANYQTSVGLQPWCNVTLNDLNPDRMNLTWEILVGGSWVTKQCNNSVKNGTYRYKYTDATSNGVGYSWRISVSDGYHNTSYAYYFTTISTAEINFGIPNPPSGSTDIPLIGSWCIQINSSNGEPFDWNITLMGFGSVTGTGDTNGTKCLAFSMLLCGTNYTVWVNASNRFDSNATKYWFWTIDCTYCPDQAYNYSNISVWWYVDLWSDNGTFNYTIECNNTQNVSGTWVANGTYWIHLTNLTSTSTYKIYVNLSTDNCWDNATYTLSFGGGASASNLFINNDRFTLGLVLGSITFLFAGMVIWRRRKEG